MYVFTSNNATAQRGTSDTPCRFGFSLRQFLVLFGLGLLLTADSPGSGLPESLFITTFMSTCTSVKDHGQDHRKTFVRRTFRPGRQQLLGPTYTPATGLGVNFSAEAHGGHPSPPRTSLSAQI